MPIINVLDKSTINQIAAGEVIERPASVIKELIENSIDAGATAVTCEIADGGISLIRITDNGTGIERDDIRTAFLRHATSKIRSAEDLSGVLSLGFRGEALASIAAVSKTELITKTRDSYTGTRMIIEGGEEQLFEEIGCPNGTTFVIRDLFANVPVRRKFLKSASTEGAYCNEAVERLALSHPGVSFKFINNGRTEVFTTGTNSVKNIVYSLYGREIAAALTEVDYTSDSGIHITGVIAKPVVARSNRGLETYFVNGRYIRNNIICKAIEDAYHPYLMQHKYPFTVLYFDIPTERMDVNVHPTKQEVRFDNGEMIYDAVFHAVADNLKERSLVPKVSPDSEAEKKEPDKPKILAKDIPEPFESRKVSYSEGMSIGSFDVGFIKGAKDNEDEEDDEPLQDNITAEPVTPVSVPPVSVPSAPKSSSPEPSVSEPVTTGSQLMFDMMSDRESVNVREETKEDFKKGLNAGYTIVGQVFSTYWIVQKGNDMYLIDQHAAHEKILFEKLMKADEERKAESQMISPSLIVSLSPDEADTLEEHMDEITSAGFDIEDFGGREFRINAVPLQLYSLDPASVLLEMIDSFREGTRSKQTLTLYERLATCACKAAVKGNTGLSYDEAYRLIEDLLKLDNPFNCPHGRPVMINMTKQELEKKFKRII